jgi:hypothetical protein
LLQRPHLGIHLPARQQLGMGAAFHHRAMRDARASITEATMYFKLLNTAWESYT